jgi:hypothetical protein
LSLVDGIGGGDPRPARAGDLGGERGLPHRGLEPAHFGLPLQWRDPGTQVT